MEDLLAARQADDAARAKLGRQVIDKLLARVELKAAASPKDAKGNKPTVDMLIISGGGDWGAFGAGVLKGWGRVKGELARPQFDVVTGVSTGAMIAPFAFIGDDESIERIVQMYRNPQADWATSRGMLFFWPSNPSFYALPGLQREMTKTMDLRMTGRIAAEGGNGLHLHGADAKIVECHVVETCRAVSHCRIAALAYVFHNGLHLWQNPLHICRRALQ